VFSLLKDVIVRVVTVMDPSPPTTTSLQITVLPLDSREGVRPATQKQSFKIRMVQTIQFVMKGCVRLFLLFLVVFKG
jgi:hypothetical protein